jgi:hypothetical protein
MIKQFFEKPVTDDVITVVSGLPRSGTSMMMKMLEMGGLQPLVDNVRKADLDNPNGYYEFERVKKLQKGETSWLPEAQGKVVKIIATLLPYLPKTYHYRMVFVYRDMREILASQKKMLINRGEDPNKVSDEDLGRIFEKHLARVKQWIRDNPNVASIDVDYNRLMQDPIPEIARINAFFEAELDEKKMASVINGGLYRQRIKSPPED